MFYTPKHADMSSVILTCKASLNKPTKNKLISNTNADLVVLLRHFMINVLAEATVTFVRGVM
jgi:hypothetical protein